MSDSRGRDSIMSFGVAAPAVVDDSSPATSGAMSSLTSSTDASYMSRTGKHLDFENRPKDCTPEREVANALPSHPSSSANPKNMEHTVKDSAKKMVHLDTDAKMISRDVVSSVGSENSPTEKRAGENMRESPDSRRQRTPARGARSHSSASTPRSTEGDGRGRPTRGEEREGGLG